MCGIEKTLDLDIMIIGGKKMELETIAEMLRQERPNNLWVVVKDVASKKNIMIATMNKTTSHYGSIIVKKEAAFDSICRAAKAIADITRME